MSKFDLFWAAYPKKKGKLEAQKKFEKIDPMTQDQIINHVKERVGKDAQWNRGFIQGPATFIHQGGWLDEYEVEKKAVVTTPTQSGSILCPNCKSHLRSGRHQRICIEHEEYYDQEYAGRRFVLSSAGQKFIELGVRDEISM